MKAIVQTKSGPPRVLRLMEVDTPVPKDNEILVKIHASTVTRGDIHLRRIPRAVLAVMGILLGFKPKRITGHEFSGVIEAAGGKVTRFRRGDHVFGTTTGLSDGSNAEYVCVPEEWKTGVVAIKPAAMSFEEAAAVPIGGMTAVQLLNRTKIAGGQRVLIYGASGSVGTYALQLARHYGADVTGVCGTANMELVKSLGAGTVIDYTEKDFTDGGIIYDVIFDAVGKITRSRCRKSLKKNGSYLSVKSLTHEVTEDLLFLKELIEQGKITAVIDRRYPLEKISEAHEYVQRGHKKGNVVITPD